MFGLAELRTEVVVEPVVVSSEIYYIDVRPGTQTITIPPGVSRFALRLRDPVSNAVIMMDVPRTAQPGDLLVFGRVEDLASGRLNGKRIEGSTRFRVSGKVENFSEPEKDVDYFCAAIARNEE